MDTAWMSAPSPAIKVWREAGTWRWRINPADSASQVDQIASSMREWGWTNPVLVDEAGTIIAGIIRRRLGRTAS